MAPGGSVEFGASRGLFIQAPTPDSLYRESKLSLHGYPRIHHQLAIFRRQLQLQISKRFRRLRVWRPRKAAVMGAGTIGLLATLVLRLRGLEVTTFGLTRKPYRNSDLIEGVGARYESTADVPLMEGAKKHGPFDIIFEATGYSPVVFDSMQALGKNGVLVLSSVTGGNRKVEVPADKINLEFVLGNKVMVGTVNANREYFESGVRDMAQAEAEYPGWLGQLLTNPVTGLENYRELINQLNHANGAIKVFCEVAPY